MKSKISKNTIYYYLPFFIVVLTYTVVLSITPIVADDLALANKYVGITWLQEWNNILFDYFNWSSRIIINAAIHIFLGHRKIYWVLATGVVILMMLVALDIIFNPEKDKKKNLTIVLIFAIFPFYLLAGSGWRVGTISYFWTTAAAVVGIIPLVMITREERVPVPMVVFSTISLIFAGNLEQCLVVLLVIYSAFFCYFFIKKKMQWAFLVQCVTLLASFVFILTAPGNGARAQTESIVRFKDFEMLSLLDKLDLGFSSTMQKIMFTGNVVFLIFIISLAIYIVSNYQSKFYRVIGIIPLSVGLIVGYAKPWLIAEYNNISNLIGAVPPNGMITVDNYLSLFPYVKLAIFLFTGISIVIGLYLIFGNTYKTIFAEALLFGGIASRVILGFSPSIWVSGDRTYLFLYFCLLMISLMIINQIKEDNLKKSWQGSLLQYSLAIFGALSILNLLASV
ncbi:DUF6056 family protein [Acetobacterium wieringae]|uniref:DUF6056 family protein n=1 Tax=Acetobacterium wieringae TaxID=52694 RepID=UPI002B1F6B72|nr:DUF6056 family protein [Acetobacterium wieringae]MEA4806041.1 DUF6056 family protein [Acetobacterium wieringae]